MKNILFTFFALLLTAFSAQAQTVNINHSGIQTTYDANNITDINVGEDASLTFNQKEGTALSLATKNITSIECSDETPDFCRKTVDGQPAQVVFSCIEVNNTNPLQTMNYKLEKANKYLFDAVILFSSNINFSKRDNEVYIHNNDNVQAILNNYDHYIKPLKDRGIKVLLSILGNHDGSGLANMSDERCRDFAKAIADTLDKYDLDGVFFDDEYSEYNKDLGAQGFAGFDNRGSVQRASRLSYETKKAIGDRWVVLYKYSAFNSQVEVDGVKPGDYLDYVLTDYGQCGVWQNISTSSFAGLRKEQYGPYSINMGQYTNFTNVKKNRTDKYGALMLYNCDQESGNFGYVYYDVLQKVAKTIFDDNIVVDDTHHYGKDWTPVEGLSEPNRP